MGTEGEGRSKTWQGRRSRKGPSRQVLKNRLFGPRAEKCFSTRCLSKVRDPETAGNGIALQGTV